MRRNHLLIALGLCALGAGCETPIGSGFEVWRYASRNFFEMPIESRDDCAERARHRHEAEAAWEKVQAAHPEQAYTVYYGQGFRDGFADYLYAGGNGQPPVLPPWYYRRTVHETPEGIASAEDWFAGYRHGAKAAEESGLRQLVLVPTALPGQAPVVIFKDTPRTNPQRPPAPAGGAVGPTLPPPRPVPPEEIPPGDASQKRR